MIQPKFDQYATHYDHTTPIQSEVVHYLWQKIHAYQSQAFSQNLLLTWLDVGCGTGKLSQELLNNATHNDFQLIALDNSPAMLEQFSQQIKALPFSQQITLLNADMTAIPLQNHSVDRVISSFALHWADISVLEELARVSRVRGQVHLAIPVAGSLSAVSERYPLLPIFPFLSADDWLEKIETLLKSSHRQARGGQWLYNEQHTFCHNYPNLATLLNSLKQMGGAVSGQMPMNGMILKQYLADTKPIDLDYRVLVVGFEI